MGRRRELSKGRKRLTVTAIVVVVVVDKVLHVVSIHRVIVISFVVVAFK